MKTHGTLSRWNDDRGFGFITPAAGGEDVFVHVSAFPRDGQRPRVGELLGFEIEPGPDGRKRAVALTRPQQASRLRTAPMPPAQARPRRSLLGRMLPLVAIVSLVFGYERFSGHLADPSRPDDTSPSIGRSTVTESIARIPAAELAAPIPATESPPATSYRCDGRTYCSQMTSCEEATYFLKNCPGTRMDGGDRDGVPCEEQWCGHN